MSEGFFNKPMKIPLRVQHHNWRPASMQMDFISSRFAHQYTDYTDHKVVHSCLESAAAATAAVVVVVVVAATAAAAAAAALTPSVICFIVITLLIINCH